MFSLSACVALEQKVWLSVELQSIVNNSENEIKRMMNGNDKLGT